MSSVDRLGRIVIPAGIRQQAGLLPGTPVHFALNDGAVILTRAGSRCVFCGGTDIADTHMDKGVCAGCLWALRAAVGGRTP